MSKTSIILGGAIAAAMSAAAFAAVAKEPGDRFERLDVNKDGIVTADEMDARHAAMIEAADANGDGGVSKDEMRAFRKAKREEMRAKHSPDTNDDGVVDRLEFQDAANKRFDRLDKNGDGVLSEDERERRRGNRHRGHRRGGQVE